MKNVAAKAWSLPSASDGRLYSYPEGHAPSGFIPEAGFGVSGDFTGGGVLTVTGASFGVGPNIVVYADWHTGTLDALIPTTDCEIGAWSSVGTLAPFYRPGRDGGFAQGVWYTVRDGNNYSQFLKTGIPNYNEYFISWYMHSGQYFGDYPNANSLGPLNIKTLWHMSGGFNGNGTDSDNEMLMLAGNEGGAPVPYFKMLQTGNGAGNTTYYPEDISPDEWNFAGWNHWQQWLRADQADPYLVAQTKLWLNNGIVSKSLNGGGYLPFIAGHNTFWNQINVAGFVGNFFNGATGLDIRYDDVYIATGPNCAKRFLVADAATFAAARDTYICWPSAWADTLIALNLPHFAPGYSLSGKYLIYYDVDNVETLVGRFP